MKSTEQNIVPSPGGLAGGPDAAAVGGSSWLGGWALAVIFTLLMLAAVSGASFWIDEAVTAELANQPTLGGWWHDISTSRMTDVQMPLYTIYVWAYAKFFGVGEFPLRLAGALCLIPGLTAFVASFPRGRQRWAALFVAATNAFIWYYANEARTYAMQMGGSFLVVAALHSLASRPDSSNDEGRWLCCFAIGLFVICGSSLLGMIWASAALGAAWVLFPAERLLGWWRTQRWWWVSYTVFLAALGVYYLNTLRMGARGSDVGTTDLRTTAFILFDQLGFGGLGPGRTALRAGGPRALLPYAPGLLCYGVALGAIVFCALREAWRRAPRKLAGVAVVVLVPWLFLSVVGIVTHFRLLGRHSSPLLALWLFLIASGASVLLSKPGWLGRTLVGIFLALGLCSSLSVRYAYRQSKDDYRRASAVAAAALAEHQRVWWSADDLTARYYHLPVSDTESSPGEVWRAVNLPEQALDALPPPGMIVTSRPDLYDGSGALARYMDRHGFTLQTAFPAFEIWTRPASK